MHSDPTPSNLRLPADPTAPVPEAPTELDLTALDLTDEIMDMDWRDYQEKFVRTDSRYLRFAHGIELEMAQRLELALCREQHAHHATFRRLMWAYALNAVLFFALSILFFSLAGTV